MLRFFLIDVENYLDWCCVIYLIKNFNTVFRAKELVELREGSYYNFFSATENTDKKEDSLEEFEFYAK